MVEEKETVVTKPESDAPTEVQRTVTRSDRPSIAERLVWFVESVILALLTVRFIFRLLGANPNNAIADFVYSASRPLVAPFVGLFNYDENLVHGRFEFETLIAIAVYLLIGWLLMELIAAFRRD